jgi:acetylornithine deacetylase/succinyl-diaminopimelate desuccinylase-like protein
VEHELTIHGHAKDLHSGNFGGIIQNPADILSYIVSRINDQNGKIKIAGFYSDVVEEKEEERKLMRSTGPSDKVLLSEAGSKKYWGELGFNNYERTAIRPSVVVSTLQSGHIGEGCKKCDSFNSSCKIKYEIGERATSEKLQKFSINL